MFLQIEITQSCMPMALALAINIRGSLIGRANVLASKLHSVLSHVP